MSAKPRRGATNATSIAVVKIARTTSDRRLATRRTRSDTCVVVARAKTSRGVSMDMNAVRYNRVDVGGFGVADREAGPVSGPALLLLHGFPTSSHMFRNLIPKLADRYRVVAPDLPGFGQSDLHDPPGAHDVQLDLFLDYASNVDMYSQFQE